MKAMKAMKAVEEGKAMKEGKTAKRGKEKKAGKGIFKWVIVGLLIRLVLMPISFHPDIRAIDFGAFLIAKEGAFFSFYDYLSRLDPGSFLVRFFGADLFIYPPLAYLIPGFFMFLFSSFYNFNFQNQFILDTVGQLGSSSLFHQLFLLKLPYLFADLLIAFLLKEIFKGKKGSSLAFKLWLLNPFSLYASFLVGQIDVFIVLSLVAAFYFAGKDKKMLALISLGLGGAVKLVPLLFLPIFALVLEKSFLKRVRLIPAGALSYLAVVGPYLLFSPGYRRFALLAGQTEKMFYMKLPVSGAEGIPVFALGLFLLLFLAAKKGGKKEFLFPLGLALLLLFFSVTHYHPQWFLWLTPFFVWLLVDFGKKFLLPIVVLSFCFLVHLVFFDPSLHLGLFAPLFPGLIYLKEIKSVFGFDGFFIKNLARALFAATAIFTTSEVIRLVGKKEK